MMILDFPEGTTHLLLIGSTFYPGGSFQIIGRAVMKSNNGWDVWNADEYGCNGRWMSLSPEVQQSFQMVALPDLQNNSSNVNHSPNKRTHRTKEGQSIPITNLTDDHISSIVNNHFKKIESMLLSDMEKKAWSVASRLDIIQPYVLELHNRGQWENNTWFYEYSGTIHDLFKEKLNHHFLLLGSPKNFLALMSGDVYKRLQKAHYRLKKKDIDAYDQEENIEDIIPDEKHF